MEQIESIQKANRQQRLAEWSQRVEAVSVNSGAAVEKGTGHSWKR